MSIFKFLDHKFLVFMYWNPVSFQFIHVGIYTRNAWLKLQKVSCTWTYQVDNAELFASKKKKDKESKAF